MTSAGTAPGGIYANLTVATPVFEGPIDLLLTLAQRREVDLGQVRLADLAWDYLKVIQEMPRGGGRNPEEIASFLLVASRLLALKAAALMPSATADDDEEEDLERWEEQVRGRLQEYERFKAAAMDLMRRHQEGGPSFPSALESEIVPMERLEIDPDGLAAAFKAVLDRLPPPTEVAVELSNYSLTDEMERIRARLRQPDPTAFTALFEAAESRLHAVVIFLALLELIRLGETRVRQRATFGDIEVAGAA